MTLPPADPQPIQVADEIARDFALLDALEAGGPAAFRTWRCRETAVIIGRGQTAENEVNVEFCRRKKIEVLRRGSGGGAVVIGPGTLQYAFVASFQDHPELLGIARAKRFLNCVLAIALGSHLPLDSEPGGDLLLANRKVAGLAMRRRRRGLLIHGTILEAADLTQIANVLKHPSREPSYRAQRQHLDFLSNLGPVETRDFEHRVAAELEARGIRT